VPLTDLKYRKCVCPAGRKQVKLTDGGSLFLLVNDRGGKYWRMNYRWQGRQQTLAMGVYPDISLAEAREKREVARKMLREGQNPAKTRRASAKNQFADIADEWMTIRRLELSDGAISRHALRLRNIIHTMAESARTKQKKDLSCA